MTTGEVGIPVLPCGVERDEMQNSNYRRDGIVLPGLPRQRPLPHPLGPRVKVIGRLPSAGVCESE